jgi:uncharacterized 2Fe-2S/4Fe-4S cluster protein (DUF4445 family)
MSMAHGKAYLKVKILKAGIISEVSAAPGTLLIDLLRENNSGITAVCGGKGICKKCTVEIQGLGPVLSCRYRVEQDCTVVLPENAESDILTFFSPHIRDVEGKSGLVPSPVTQYGFAVDIGTTTVVVYFLDLKEYRLIGLRSFMNPQGEYGQDVISRIHYTMENKKGLPILQQKVLDSVNGALTEIFKQHGIEKGAVQKAVFTGNNTMLHLLLGVDPASIALAPFTPAFTEKKSLKAGELALEMAPDGTVMTLPSVSAYVGADITGGLAAVPLAASNDFSLFIDIGTNGEMALGSRETILACSTAAGPAFEGARIQCGMGGVFGAIAKYNDGKYETIGNAKPMGICGSGLVDIIAYLLDQGMVTPEGYLEKDYVLVPAKVSGTGKDIVITPRDIRETQLAKAAVAAGIRVLIEQSGKAIGDIRHVYLAGGFGNTLNVESAVRIGLIPGELGKKVVQVGNSAGAGALLALKSTDFAARVQEIADKCRYIELSSRPDFNDYFMDEMHF